MTNPAGLPSNPKSTSRYLMLLALAATVWLACTAAFAAEGSSEGIEWGAMTMGLFGGLALFLFGMEQMSDALKSAVGDLKLINAPPGTC